MTITAARYAGQDPERIPNPGACLPLGKEESQALEIALETAGAELKPCGIWPGFTHLLKTTDGWFYPVAVAAEREPYMETIAALPMSFPLDREEPLLGPAHTGAAGCPCPLCRNPGLCPPLPKPGGRC